jgi:glycerol-3-phosphate acyltransferase PlsY
MLLSILVILAYLLGSIPTSVWVGKYFYNIDVREHGSGNAGATNTMRVLGWKAGVPVLLFDALKGWMAVMLILFTNIDSSTPTYINIKILLGIVAVIGHIFPIYVGFRGGKGVATLLGMVIAITPIPAIIAFGIFSVVLLLTKYVSAGSITAGISYPIMIFTAFNYNSMVLNILSILIAVLLVITHRKNIERLIKGEESKAGFLVKKK